MRTTVSIQNTLLAQAKKVSLERRCSLGEVIEDALRMTFSGQAKTAGIPQVQPIKTFKGSGIQPGVDLNSNAALMDTMEDL
jgi:hypothetical protein